MRSRAGVRAKRTKKAKAAKRRVEKICRKQQKVRKHGNIKITEQKDFLKESEQVHSLSFEGKKAKEGKHEKKKPSQEAEEGIIEKDKNKAKKRRRICEAQ